METSDSCFKKTSIIVCTVDRLPDLDRCLASLQPFRAAKAEVIVVNNGPRGAEVEDIANRHGARVATEPRRGVSRARNAGIRAATGSIVAFLDDDSVADPDWLPLLLDPLRKPQVLAVVGSVWPQALSDPVAQAFHGMHQAEFPRSQITLEASENPFPLRMALIGNANMAFRRDVFDRIGYFDVRFGRGTRIGANEEPEILLAVLLGGGKIVAEPAARIYHRHSTEWRAFRQWAFRSGCGHTAILTKYYLQKPSLRRAIVRYATSRIFRRREKQSGSLTPTKAKIPRLSLLLGSLYGPLAFLLSGKQ